MFLVSLSYFYLSLYFIFQSEHPILKGIGNNEYLEFITTVLWFRGLLNDRPFLGEQLELIGVVEHAFIRAQSGDAAGVAPGECVGEAERERGWGRERGRGDHTERARIYIKQGLIIIMLSN